jgi:predicted amidohydrolase
MRIGCLQTDSPLGESRTDRIDRVLAELRSAPQAELLVLPELWDVGYFAFDRYEAEATPLDDGPVAEIGRVAADRGCVIVAGSVLERHHGRLFNTIAALDRDGALLDTYRKVHLFPIGSREGDLLSAGDRIVVVPTPLGRLGLATCFDLRFPTQFETMRDEGVDLFCLVSAWPARRVEHWRVLTRARAIETQTPLIACNGTGDGGGVELAGESVVVNARGDVVVGADRRIGWVVADLDTDETRAWRRDFPLRPEPDAATRLSESPA